MPRSDEVQDRLQLLGATGRVAGRRRPRYSSRASTGRPRGRYGSGMALEKQEPEDLGGAEGEIAEPQDPYHLTPREKRRGVRLQTPPTASQPALVENQEPAEAALRGLEISRASFRLQDHAASGSRMRVQAKGGAGDPRWARAYSLPRDSRGPCQVHISPLGFNCYAALRRPASCGMLRPAR